MSNVQKTNSAALNPSVSLPGGKTMTRAEILTALKIKPDTPLDAWLFCQKCDKDNCGVKSATTAQIDALSKDRLSFAKEGLLETKQGTITVSEASALLSAGVITQTALTAVQLHAIRAFDPKVRTC